MIKNMKIVLMFCVLMGCVDERPEGQKVPPMLMADVTEADSGHDDFETGNVYISCQDLFNQTLPAENGLEVEIKGILETWPDAGQDYYCGITTWTNQVRLLYGRLGTLVLHDYSNDVEGCRFTSALRSRTQDLEGWVCL